MPFPVVYTIRVDGAAPAKRGWSVRRVVAALQALRGVALVSAIILMAEIGDFRRFVLFGVQF